MIRDAQLSDASSICEIYNYFVRDTVVTFEEAPVSNDAMQERIRNVIAAWPWYVWEEEGVVAGYAYATPWMSRSAYRFAVETTVYLSPEVAGRGIGSRLYTALIAELRARGAHSAVGGIALPNPGSVALHEKLGFRKVAHFSEIGYKFGSWVDVGYWELLLD